MTVARKVGITTTIPVEVLFAGGVTPVDLNNLFITHPDPLALVEAAEGVGFPITSCGWIKGLYTTALQTGLTELVAVTQGDCSNTHALMETLELQKVKIVPFAYPYDRDPDLLRLQIEKLMQAFGASRAKVKRVKEKLDALRAKVKVIDELTWQEGKVTGRENHYYQVSCSDFEGEPPAFEKKTDDFLAQVQQRPPARDFLPLGFVGVPPIFPSIYDYLETLGARVIYNEVQRQFAMPYGEQDLIEQYRRYTYPYGIFGRLEDIEAQIAQRNLAGIIHYVQAFCFRQIEDIVLRKRLKVPVLTLEGDKPTPLDSQRKLRLESFVEMLRRKKKK